MTYDSFVSNINSTATIALARGYPVWPFEVLQRAWENIPIRYLRGSNFRKLFQKRWNQETFLSFFFNCWQTCVTCLNWTSGALPWGTSDREWDWSRCGHWPATPFLLLSGSPVTKMAPPSWETKNQHGAKRTVKPLAPTYLMERKQQQKKPLISHRAVTTN